MLRDWGGFQPSAVIVAHGQQPTVQERVWRRIRDDGLRNTLTRKHPRRRKSTVSADVNPADLRTMCQQRGIPVIDVESLGYPRDLQTISALRPDLFVFAGGGILRKALLAIPRVGARSMRTWACCPFTVA